MDLSPVDWGWIALGGPCRITISFKELIWKGQDQFKIITIRDIFSDQNTAVTYWKCQMSKNFSLLINETGIHIASEYLAVSMSVRLLACLSGREEKSREGKNKISSWMLFFYYNFKTEKIQTFNLVGFFHIVELWTLWGLGINEYVHMNICAPTQVHTYTHTYTHMALQYIFWEKW